MEDNRGYFLKSFEYDIFKKMGLENKIAENFESYSLKNVIRGLHFQTKNPQIKLIRVISGEILDVVVDLRKGMPTYGKSFLIIINSSNHKQLYIPAGFAHGFKVISDYTIMSYICIGKYEKGYDNGIIWNDSKLNIDWRLDNQTPKLSEKDKNLMTFDEFEKMNIIFK